MALRKCDVVGERFPALSLAKKEEKHPLRAGFVRLEFSVKPKLTKVPACPPILILYGDYKQKIVHLIRFRILLSNLGISH